ncbi:MAG: efflux RND transporter periplasmic adaptor subunit [Deltaproteobacteria bacterium]|nr:efflux RND transporter periplasmic adaptor subunit [Deltaproteobacteria bacterium]
MPAPAVLEVRTVAVERGTIAQRIRAPGSLDALRESHIGAEVRGRLWKVYVDDGDRVGEGDPLFQIDPEPYVLAFRQAKAGRDLARAERRQMQSDFARAQALLRKDVISRQEVDRLGTRVDVAKAHERQADEAVDLAKLNLSRTLAQAPYSGTIAKRLADEGTTALVQPQTVVVVLQETQELEGRATIPEAHLQAVHVGDRAVIRVEGLAEPIETLITSVGDAVDAATRTYEVKMRVPNPDYRLKAGVFAVLTVQDGRAVAVAVRLGVMSPKVAEVSAGLEAGQRVIVGQEAKIIAPGMRVREREDGEGAS